MGHVTSTLDLWTSATPIMVSYNLSLLMKLQKFESPDHSKFTIVNLQLPFNGFPVTTS